MTASADVQKARSIASELTTDATRCIAWFAIWERAHPKNDDIRERYNETYEAHAVSMTADALHISMIIALLRMHDHDKRTASIPSLLRLLRRSNVMDELKELSPSQRENADSWTRSAAHLYEKLEGDKTLGALRKLRNHVIAHVELDKATLHAAKYGYEQRVLEQTNEVVNLLYLATHAKEFDFPVTWEVWRGYADFFWASAVKSPMQYRDL